MIPFSRFAEQQILTALIRSMTNEELDYWLQQRARMDRVVIQINLHTRTRYGWTEHAGQLVFTAHTDEPDGWVERLVECMDLDHPFVFARTREEEAS